MNLKQKLTTIFLPGLLLPILIVMGACTSSLDTYQGKNADPNSRIALNGGSHNGMWQTDDLTVNYSYTRRPNQLQISGDVGLRDKLKDESEVVTNFVLQVNFLNAAGRALGTKELVVAGYREMETNWHFDHNFELPARTAAVAFSYQGQMGADATGGAEQGFWHDPFQ